MKWKLIHIKDRYSIEPTRPFNPDNMSEKPKKYYRTYGEAMHYIHKNSLDGEVIPVVAKTYNIRHLTLFETFVHFIICGLFLAGIYGACVFLWFK